MIESITTKGWDRTAQVCSLAQVLVDPYYRTLQGFQSLIEKDWLSFGHKFTDRCGYLQSDAKETSPVFTQLVDCMWQLQRAYPAAFQFSERLLLHLHDHVYSSQYGTFVGNCEKDRLDLKVNNINDNNNLFSFFCFLRKNQLNFVIAVREDLFAMG